MAETEKQKLERYIYIIEDWHGNRLPAGIISTFFNLEDLDESQHAEQWELLRQAIINNKEFEWPPFLDEMELFVNRTSGNRRFWWKLIVEAHRKTK